MFHKFQSQINDPFLADSHKKCRKEGLSSDKSCEYGGKTGLADSNNYEIIMEKQDIDFLWCEDIDAAVTVCDAEGIVVYMNKLSRDTFNKCGESMVG